MQCGPVLTPPKQKPPIQVLHLEAQGPIDRCDIYARAETGSLKPGMEDIQTTGFGIIISSMFPGATWLKITRGVGGSAAAKLLTKANTYNGYYSVCIQATTGILQNASPF